MKLSEALTAMAQRAAFASEEQQRDVLAAIDRGAARLDGEHQDVTEDAIVSLTPAGAAASPRKRTQPAAKRAAKKGTGAARGAAPVPS